MYPVFKIGIHKLHFLLLSNSYMSQSKKRQKDKKQRWIKLEKHSGSEPFKIDIGKIKNPVSVTVTNGAG